MIHVIKILIVGILYGALLFPFQVCSNYINTYICFVYVQVLTAIGNFCICSIAVGMIIEIVVMYPIQHRAYRPGIDNLLVLLIGGIPIAMPTVLSVTMAIGSHRLSQQVSQNHIRCIFIEFLFYILSFYVCLLSS